MKNFLIVICVIFIFVVNLMGDRILILGYEIDKLDNITKSKIIRKTGKFLILDLDKEEIKKLEEKGIKIIYEKKGIHKSMIPTDAYFNKQWWVQNIKLDFLWNNNTDCSNIIVAVVDTGVDYNHVDLKNNIYVNPNEICGNGKDDDNNGFVDDCYGYDFANNDSSPIDDDSESHGTHVAGTIGAEGNNGIGVAGVCWKIKILPVKVLDKYGNGYYSDVADGIKYAVDRGANIINLSLETNYIDEVGLSLFEDAISYAFQHNVIITSAAGNQGKDLDVKNVYPASFRKKYPNIIVTASLDKYGNLSSFSDYGDQTVDIAIPGEDIYSTLRNNNYGYQSGSSMANSITTGIIAQIMTIYNNFSFNFIRAKLIDMAKSIQRDIVTVSSGTPDLTKILNNIVNPLIFSIKFPQNSEYMDIFGYNLETSKFYINEEVINPEYCSKYFCIVKANKDSSFTVKAIKDDKESNIIKISTNFTESECLDYEFINYLPNGWSLIGTNCDIKDFSIFSNVHSVWVWTNSKWKVYSSNNEIKKLLNDYGLESPDVIFHKQGMWVYK